jgi:phospholipid/cholesterol/gamma-HCH transport system permease protein
MASRAIDRENQALFEIAPTAEGGARLSFTGRWLVGCGMPGAEELIAALAAKGASRRVTLDGQQLVAWDTGFLTVVDRLARLGKAGDLEVDSSGLPDGANRLLQLAGSVPERAGARRDDSSAPLVERVGKRSIALLEGGSEVLAFIGAALLAFGNILRGRPGFRRSDFLQVVQEVGAQALPIVSLVSFLVGAILAFLGAVQLQQFGAQIFVADLVAIGMARDMAAMMVGIILAGRTGAAFAAQLGTMQVNEEIDALTTMGFSPMSFLVMPRMLALILMTPLLCLYANLMGMLGGMAVGVLALDLSATVYLQQTWSAAPPLFFIGGLIKATAYGIVVAVTVCLRGLQCGRSAAAVGDAATSAVVTSLVFIILTMALLTLTYNALGI